MNYNHGWNGLCNQPDATKVGFIFLREPLV